MKLYYAPASSYSQRVLIALYEKNANFIPVEVNLFDAQARDCYLQINPFGKIPTLETDRGQVLFEACVIIEYLDQHQNKFQLSNVLVMVATHENQPHAWRGLACLPMQGRDPATCSSLPSAERQDDAYNQPFLCSIMDVIGSGNRNKC